MFRIQLLVILTGLSSLLVDWSYATQVNPLTIARSNGSEGKAPHEGLSLTYRCKPGDKAVCLRWGYVAGGEFRANEQKFAVRFTPTAIAQIDEKAFYVCGADGEGTVVIEEWSIDHPKVLPPPSTSVATGEVLYPPYLVAVSRRVVRAKKSLAPTEYIDYVFVNQGSEEKSMFVRLHGAKRFYSVHRTSGVWSVLYDGLDPVATNYLPGLSLHVSTVTAVKTERLGYSYVFLRLEHSPSSNPHVALVLSDVDKDGVIDDAKSFSDWASYEAQVPINPTTIQDTYF